MIVRTIKRIARKGIEALGYDVSLKPTQPQNARQNYVLQTIEQKRVNVVLDIGANSGQFAASLRKRGYRGRIVSYEPLSNAFEQLSLISADDSQWTVVNEAVGAESGQADINVSKNSWSSSFLTIEPLALAAEPSVAVVGKELVRVTTLDRVCATHLFQGDVAFLKLDVQGFESSILQAAPTEVERFVAVISETSLCRHYTNEWRIQDLIIFFDLHGFDPVDINDAFREPRSGQLIQVDVLFHRRP